MKLAAITDEISMDFEHALDVMLQYGVQSAELRSLWNVNVTDLSDEQVSRAKAALESRGMSVACIASPFFKCDLRRFEGGASGNTHQARQLSLDDQPALLLRCIELARVFDTKLIRVFSFWRKSELTKEIEEEIVQEFRAPVARAEEEGVVLALENEGACFTRNGDETARVVRAIDSPALRIVWDPGNAFGTGEEPFPQGYEAVKDLLVHVHVKDPVMNGDNIEFVRMGEGSIPYEDQFRALKADGYQGYISLETHFNPGGSSEDGSRACLVSLDRLMSSI